MPFSIALQQTGAYRERRRELSTGLAIEQLEIQWTEYTVLRLDLNAETYTDMTGREAIVVLHLARWRKRYPTELAAASAASLRCPQE
jgi:hypothetical protein